MKIYKYRDLSNPDEETLKRLYQLIINNLVWCACPDQLNDKDEFLFEIDYAPTESTAHLLSQILAHDKTISPEDALSLASHYIMNNKLEHIASPIMKSMMENCRNSLGVACFSISKDNAVMWERYGGNGNGICIEIDVPDNLIDKTLFRVTYVSKKTPD